eukprot:GGOE01003313.1.p1 GENE.GGOE01003313.1~~GGOE01003313.1.p1  ORF type:complete len:104 (-),score=20.85 GGOE01003313.1:224-499(-)
MPPDRCLGVVSISGDPSLTLPSDKPNKQLTLVLLTRQAADGSGREVLLGQKKRGFGAAQGGPERCMRRRTVPVGLLRCLFTRHPNFHADGV